VAKHERHGNLRNVTATKRIGEVITRGLAPHLRAEGYRKKGRTFRAKGLPGMRVVNVQASQWNWAKQARFTLNLGVYFGELVAMVDEVPKPEPLEYDCMVRSRIGSLMPSGLDHWWQIDESANLEALAADVATAYETYARSWLARMATLEGFVASHAPTRYRAAAAMCLGEGDRARTLLSRAMPRAEVDPELRARLQKCVDRWGLR